MDGYDPNALHVDKARAVIRSYLTPVTETERLPVRLALGRVLAEDIVSTMNVPAHDNSAMDGYALRHADLAGEGDTPLKVIGTALAGKAFPGAPGKGECVRVMTGAVMPAGCDTVVIQEIVKTDADTALIPHGQKRGQNRRFAGEDLALGKVILKAGQPVRPAELGLIASLGIGEVSVRRRLRVAFFSTGDELVSVGKPLQEGQVYDSNRYTLWGMLARLDVEIIDLGVVPDDPHSLEYAFNDAASKADAVITSGGVSVGEADFTRKLLGQMGEVLFWKIAMKPGRPMAFGKIGKAHFFGLPGNPVAVMVTFHQFVRDALLHIAGRSDDTTLPLLKMPCTSAIKKSPGRTEYVRGRMTQTASGEWQVAITGSQGSGVLRSMSEANCFIVLGHEQAGVKPGDPVSVQVFDGVI
jgi:molybdopterin molybdotransferase